MKKAPLKKRIFDSAKHLVEKEGMAQLNVRKVAQLSDCSLGSLYNAFDNFQELQLHINASILSDLFSSLNAVINKGIEEKKTFRQILKDLGLAYIDFGQKNRMLWKAIFEHFSQNDLPTWYSKRTQEGIYGISQTLASAFGISQETTKRLIGFYWTSIHGMSAILLNKKMEMVSELFHDDYLNQYIECALNGLFSADFVDEKMK